jgi:hypothetical protein
MEAWLLSKANGYDRLQRIEDEEERERKRERERGGGGQQKAAAWRGTKTVKTKEATHVETTPPSCLVRTYGRLQRQPDLALALQILGIEEDVVPVVLHQWDDDRNPLHFAERRSPPSPQH